MPDARPGDQGSVLSGLWTEWTELETRHKWQASRNSPSLSYNLVFRHRQPSVEAARRAGMGPSHWTAVLNNSSQLAARNAGPFQASKLSSLPLGDSGMGGDGANKSCRLLGTSRSSLAIHADYSTCTSFTQDED